MQGIRPGLIPFVWAEEGGGATPALADQLKSQLLTPMRYARTIVAVLAAVSPLILTFLLILRFTRGPDEKKLTRVSPTPPSDGARSPPPPPPPMPPPMPQPVPPPTVSSAVQHAEPLSCSTVTTPLPLSVTDLARMTEDQAKHLIHFPEDQLTLSTRHGPYANGLMSDIRYQVAVGNGMPAVTLANIPRRGSDPGSVSRPYTGASQVSLNHMTWTESMEDLLGEEEQEAGAAAAPQPKAKRKKQRLVQLTEEDEEIVMEEGEEQSSYNVNGSEGVLLPAIQHEGMDSRQEALERSAHLDPNHVPVPVHPMQAEADLVLEELERQLDQGASGAVEERKSESQGQDG